MKTARMLILETLAQHGECTLFDFVDITGIKAGEALAHLGTLQRAIPSCVASQTRDRFKRYTITEAGLKMVELWRTEQGLSDGA